MNVERKIIFPLLCLSLMIFSNSVYAIGIKKNQIGIGIGLSHYATRDYIVSPLIYSGWGIPFNLYYQYEGNKNVHTVKYYYGEFASTSAGGHTAKNVVESIHYGYGRHVTSFLQNNGRIFIGGVIGSVITRGKLTFETGRITRGANTYADLIHLSLICSGRYFIDPVNSLEMNFTIPIIGYTYRPGYSLGPSDKRASLNGSYYNLKSWEFVTPLDFSLFNATFSYNRSLSGSFGARVQYEFEYYHIRDPRAVSTVLNKLYFTFFFQFGGVR